MRNKKLSRILSLLLVLCLVMGVFPIIGTATAAGLPKRSARDEQSLRDAIKDLKDTGGTRDRGTVLLSPSAADRRDGVFVG